MSTPRPMRLRALAAAAICAAAIGIAACGDDEEEPATTTGATETTGEVTTGETTTGGEETTGGEATTGDETTTGGLPSDPAELRDEFNRQLLQVLQDQGLSEEQAQCAVDELENTITDEEVQEAITSGDASGLTDRALDAGEKCRDAG